MNGPPRWWARRAVDLAVRALPDEARPRYRQEFLAELHGMSRLDQLRHVTGLIGRMTSLRPR